MVSKLLRKPAATAPPGDGRADAAIELTILMPCLNEAETIGDCIREARQFLDTSGVSGEIVIADNGSTDDSRSIATAHGVQVVPVERRGYGAALAGGIVAARGKFVIMGDADCSYDFLRLMPFLEQLRDGADLVMGNRFRGGIERGAMPLLHRYFGNPFLSLLGRHFFRIGIGDFHCGLRGFNRDRMLALDLRTTGMEFASEMVVRAALAHYSIVEVPTTLKPDGRTRPPHLRTWADGWTHLRFLLMYSPRWLFLYPGLLLLGFGLVGTVLLLPGPLHFGRITLDIHSFIVTCAATLLGLQSIGFAAVTRRFGLRNGFIPSSSPYARILERLTLERMLIAALVLFLLGSAGFAWCFGYWASTDFGQLEHGGLVRAITLSLTAIVAGIQLAFVSFLLGIMDIPIDR